MSNPLLDISTLPRFSEIKAEQIEPVIDQILEDNRKKLSVLLQQNKDDIT